MGYTNCLMVSQMKELDLFDNISYKYIKNIIKHDDDDIEVEIERLDCDRVAYCRTRFTFKISQGKVYVWDTEDTYKEFVVEKEYNNSSAYALMMLELYEESDEEDDEDTDDEDSDFEDDDDWKYLCPNLHWGGEYGCDLCHDVKDVDNQEMMKEWLNKNNKQCYKLHKKWLEDKKDKEEEEEEYNDFDAV